MLLKSGVTYFYVIKIRRRGRERMVVCRTWRGVLDITCDKECYRLACGQVGDLYSYYGFLCQ